MAARAQTTNSRPIDKSKPRRFPVTEKVIDKIKEMGPYETSKLFAVNDEQAVTMPRRRETDNTARSDFSKRCLWNPHLDEILLDGLITKRVAVKYHIKQTTFEEICNESLPGFTADQCRHRWFALRKLYKAKPIEKGWSLAVHEKLTVLEGERPGIEKRQYFGKVWNEENDLLMLNALTKRQSDLNTHVKSTVWNQIAEQAMPSHFTAKLCKLRYYKLRVGYLEWKTNGHSSKVSFTKKVFAKMCNMFNGNYKMPVVPEPDICRCCGQITDYLIDLDKEPDILEWFLLFTGLAVEQLVRPYTKICEICGEKLGEALKFRDICLMGAQIIKTELENSSSKEEIQENEKNEEIIVEAKPEPQPDKEKLPTCCAICSDMVEASEYQSHMRKHKAQQLKESRTCKFCQKTFSNLGVMQRHVDYHIDGDIHECTECSKKFICKGDLKKHIRLHKGKLPGHLCTLCGKIFAQHVALRHHMNAHSGTKPFQCRHCNQRFARVHGLNAHIRSRHENVRFQCGFCDLKYAQIGKLKLHTVLVHQGAILRCSSCNLESTTLKSFRFHLKNIHQTGFNQSIHVILGNGEKLVRRRKMVDSLVQTEKIGLYEDGQEIVEEEIEEEEIEAEEVPLDDEIKIDIDL